MSQDDQDTTASTNTAVTPAAHDRASSPTEHGGGMQTYNGMAYCSTCGKNMARTAPSCPSCGAPNALAKPKTSEKGMVPAALLAFFFGVLGFHRFYVGKIGTGILMILTLGGLGIWALIDFIMIIVGSFKDKDGMPLSR